MFYTQSKLCKEFYSVCNPFCYTYANSRYFYSKQPTNKQNKYKFVQPTNKQNKYKFVQPSATFSTFLSVYVFQLILALH